MSGDSEDRSQKTLGGVTACKNCVHWNIAKKTVYSGGQTILNWVKETGVGCCAVLHIDTPVDFGCNKFKEASPFCEHVVFVKKQGSPWNYWEMVTCPQCNGNPALHGAHMCRCAGTGQVRKYDDGFVGEEQTRLHPSEKGAAEIPLLCFACNFNVDVKWKVCPNCGNRLNPVADTENVGEGNQGVVGRM